MAYPPSIVTPWSNFVEVSQVLHINTIPNLIRVFSFSVKEPMPDWVFVTPANNRMAGTTMRREFYRCLAKAGIRQARFHDLRHTFASLLIQQGANPKYIQEQLGHGSIKVTMDIYGHLFEGDHRAFVSRLDDPHPKAQSATQTQPSLEVPVPTNV